MLIQGHHAVDRARRFEFVDAPANGFGHGCGISASTDKIVGKRGGCAKARVDSRGRSQRHTFFASIADDTANLAVGLKIVVSNRAQLMTNGRSPLEIRIRETAVYEYIGG